MEENKLANKVNSFYVKGDRAEYTGEIRQVAGMPLYIGVLVEGHKIGKEVCTYIPPFGTCPLSDRVVRDYNEQQEQFRKLSNLAKLQHQTKKRT